MKEKILIINDEEPVREMMRLFLQKNYDIIEAADGTEGAKMASTEKPHLILLDVMMPGLNGYDTCRQLKSDPAAKDIPVIFLSSLSDPKDKIKGLEVGGVDFITRTSDKGEILARVQTHLKIRALNQELKERNEQLQQKQSYLEEDLKAAANIQESLLPAKNLKISHLAMSWRSMPCDAIGGDVFSVIPLDDHQTAIYMLDVTGHGVPAAMVTVSVSQHLHELASSYQSIHKTDIVHPEAVLRSLDKEFPLERFDKFFSIFYMVANTSEKTFTYSNGGHPPGIYLTKEAPYVLLQQGGTVVGVNEGLPYQEVKIEYKAGGKVVLYTDGVNEYENDKGELYGMTRFCGLLEKMKQEPGEKIIEAIYEDLKRFGNGMSALDDVSVIIVEFLGE